jgi:hypothetical protein
VCCSLVHKRLALVDPSADIGVSDILICFRIIDVELLYMRTYAPLDVVGWAEGVRRHG